MRARRGRQEATSDAGWDAAALVALAVALLTSSVPIGSVAARGDVGYAPHSGTLTASPALVPMHPTPVARQPASAIDPTYAGSRSEPAPMGVTDFGVTSALSPYTYATTEWLGTASFSSLKASASGSTTMSFQLNVVLVLHGGSGNFTYWVQNVVRIDTSTELIQLVNNIWNFSSPTAGLTTTELSGNGSVNSFQGMQYYACVDSVQGNGNLVDLLLPATVQAKVTTAFFGGFPEVTFLYDDGTGWVTYDNVSFVHGGAWTDIGYVVDGRNNAPIGSNIFVDGEWDFAGAGPDYTDDASNLTMSLQYWNGNNFEYPRSAWNFGGNTGESMKHVVPRFVPDNTTGGLYAHESNGTGGSLGILYDPGQVARVTFDTPTAASGEIQLGQRNYSYVGGQARLTIAPGSYPVQLWVNGAPVGLPSWVNVTGGASRVVQLPFFVPIHSLSFQATHLPLGASWGVSVAGQHRTSPAGWLNLSVVDAVYPYTIDPVAGYLLVSGYRGSANVSGDNLTIVLTWSVYTYPTVVTPIGLPDGTGWTLSVVGIATIQSVAPASVQVELPNGSFAYSVATVRWWSADTPNGTIVVGGAAGMLQLGFSEAFSRLVGQLTPTDSQLLVDGIPASYIAPDGSFDLPAPPGSHTLVASATGYDPLTTTVNSTAGNATPRIVLLLVLHHVPAAPDGASGNDPTTTYELVGVAVVGVATLLGVALAAMRRRSPPAP